MSQPTNGILIVSSFFAQLTSVAHTQTDTQTMLHAATVIIGSICALYAGKGD